MEKTYSYHNVGPNDLRVSPNGGLVVDKSVLLEDSALKDSDPAVLWGAVTEYRRKYGDHITGCGVTFNDPVNDCTYVWWGNYYLEDIGVFTPMLPDEHDRAEHIGASVVPKHVSSMSD